MNSIRKAVFPVAGIGSRFLPVTKSNPKEMLPIVDKPLIQYAVDEAIAAGITELIFVTNNQKSSIEKYFAKDQRLSAILKQRDKLELRDVINNIIDARCQCFFITQKEPLGLGHAIGCAKDIIGDEPFVVILPDDLLECTSLNCTAEMIKLYDENQASIIAVEEISLKQTHMYGIVDVLVSKTKLLQINGIIEKPTLENGPSLLLGVIGRYILTPKIFSILENTTPSVGSEIQLTDAIASLLKIEDAYAWQYRGRRFDCGSKIGFLLANIYYGFQHPEVAQELSEQLLHLVQGCQKIV